MKYTVVKGDNLTKVAKKFGVTVNELIELNGIKDPNKIYVGQVLEVPVKEPPKNESKADSLLDEFLRYLENQIGHIYVWGAQGQTVTEMKDPEEWIRNRETSGSNANRAIAFYRKRKEEGMDPIRAFDCSGLIMAFLQNEKGVFSTDLSAKGLYGKSVVLEREELIPGDLVFRHNGQKIHHVGVYVGRGEVIEAMGRDVGVVKRDLDASGGNYWNRFGRLKCFES